MLVANRISVAGSNIGGIRETQECIEFCMAKNIKPEIEVVSADRVDTVYDLLAQKNDSIKRYVLDVSKLPN